MRAQTPTRPADEDGAQTAALRCTVALPAGFRVGDVLAFHRRDALAVAERVDTDSLHKGLVWDGHAACLTIRFHREQADAELAVDGPPAAGAAGALTAMVRRMLGLTQPVEAFEQAYRAHPQLGPLIARQAGLRVPLAASPFEALTWAITGQQISVKAAVALRRRLIQAAGVEHSGGLRCHPDACRVARLDVADLRQAGFSQTKARTLIALSREVQDNRLPLDGWLAVPRADEIGEQLVQVRGIGPWTINYTLLRGFGWLDGSLHGDVAVCRGLQSLLGRSDGITEREARCWLADFSPWRALIAAHLWAMQSAAQY
ncbi:MAG TPA: AlkA N-terminal domain-containing protein [Rhodocyclaceae bacterium]|nr:AlkA N-terminal domain-containing protein [Rhodocyclaceae bacterium]